MDEKIINLRELLRYIIINFLKEKKKLIDVFLGEDSEYIIEEDLSEISEWSLSNCIKTIEVFGNSEEIAKYGFGDADICPWCIITDKCNECSYGNRHGICADKSTYMNLCDRIAPKLEGLGYNTYSIMSAIPNMDPLVKRYDAHISLIRNNFYLTVERMIEKTTEGELDD